MLVKGIRRLPVQRRERGGPSRGVLACARANLKDQPTASVERRTQGIDDRLLVALGVGRHQAPVRVTAKKIRRAAGPGFGGHALSA